MAISRASNSSIQGGLPKFNDLWDGTTATSSFDTLGSVVLTGNSSSVTFSNIPQTYTHLQIRAISRTTRTNYSVEQVYMRFNGDTGNNYATHSFGVDGSTVYAYTGSFPNSWMHVGQTATDLATTNAFGTMVIDILEYKNTNKHKTTRSLSGVEPGATYTGFVYGAINLASGLWFKAGSGVTSDAINSITFITEVSGNFKQFSSFTLYGIK